MLLLLAMLLKLEKQGTCSTAPEQAAPAAVFMAAWSCARVVSMRGGSGGELVGTVSWPPLVARPLDALELAAPPGNFFLQMTLHRTQSSSCWLTHAGTTKASVSSLNAVLSC